MNSPALVRSLLYLRNGNSNSVTTELSELNAWASSLGLRLDVIAQNHSSTLPFLDRDEFVTRAGEGLEPPEWVQDFLTPRLDGSFSLSPNMKLGATTHLQKTVHSELEEEEVLPRLRLQGAQGRAEEAMAFVLQLELSFPGRAYFIQNCYIEIGNRLSGQKAHDGSYVVLGQDSFRIALDSLQSELPELAVSENFVKRLIADDFGIEQADLHVVEQPGVFHIDMAVALLPGLRAIVNDSVQFLNFARNQIGSMGGKRPRTFKEQIEKIQQMENQCADQRLELGFEIVSWAFRLTLVFS